MDRNTFEPQQIYNIDETGFTTVHKKYIYVIAVGATFTTFSCASLAHKSFEAVDK